MVEPFKKKELLSNQSIAMFTVTNVFRNIVGLERV